MRWRGLVLGPVVIAMLALSASPASSQQYQANRVFWGLASAPCVDCEWQVETVAWPVGTIGTPGTFSVVPRTACAGHVVVRTTSRVVSNTWRVGAHLGLYHPCAPPSSWRILYSAANA